MASQSLKYEGATMFRERIVASLLSGKTLKITKIREMDEHPGLQDYEANYLKLIENMTDGSVLEINETGTSLRFKPGLLIGGTFSHECSLSRSIGWFVEGILCLAPLCKLPLQIEFNGITNEAVDLSVDTLTMVTLPLLRNFGINGNIAVRKRGAAPKGGGVIVFTCAPVRELRPVCITDVGLVKRVRGTAFCARISPTIITRVIDSSRNVLNNLLPDVYIHTDHHKGITGGLSPGYSLTLIAETTTGALISAERTAVAGAGAGGELPEQVGEEASLLLLEEISQGGLIDSSHQALVFQLMAIGPEDVSKVRVGQLTEHAIDTLRIIRDAFGVVFKIKAGAVTAVVVAASQRRRQRDQQQRKRQQQHQQHTDEDDDDDDDEQVDDGQVDEEVMDRSTLLSCLGIGYRNMSRRVT